MLTALVATLLTLPIAAPPVAEKPADTDQTIVRVDTPAWEGEFTARLKAVPGLKSVQVTLTGTMTDKTREAQPFDASIVFVCPLAEEAVVGSGELRVVQSEGVEDVYRVVQLAPAGMLWSSATEPEVGSIEVWNGSYKRHQLSDSVIVSLVNTMLYEDRGMIGSRGEEPCSPTLEECVASARALCPDGVGTFTYECSNVTVICDFDCREPVPE